MDDSDAPNSVVVRRLTKTYGGVRAIDNVSFRIGKGEVVGFLGPNGAGKSTTMRIISGLMPASSGSVFICGESVAADPDAARRHIGFMPENNPLPEDLRVREYLTFRAGIKGVPSSEIRARVDESMETCQLLRKASNKIIGNLSKGFRQRVGIADAILSRPEVIIMDEPTIGLDPHQILAIRALINSLRGKMSVIISSHILPEIELMCDRVMIINQGTIVAGKILASACPEAAIASSFGPDSEGYYGYVLRAGENSGIGRKLISSLAADERLGLREVAHKKPSLEEIFMAATRRSWEQTSDLPEGGGRRKK